MKTIECTKAEFEMINEYYLRDESKSLEDLIGYLYWQGINELARRLSWLKPSDEFEFEVEE